jgi:hypothetical protein
MADTVGGKPQASLHLNWRYRTSLPLPCFLSTICQETGNRNFFADASSRRSPHLVPDPFLFVIARNSAFRYKGSAVDVTQVGKELGVRYVLEGSVQKAGGRCAHYRAVDRT